MLDSKDYMERKRDRKGRETDISSIYKTVTWKVDFVATKHRNRAEATRSMTHIRYGGKELGDQRRSGRKEKGSG